MSSERMRLIGFRALRKGVSLRGFASVELPPGLRIFDIPVHRGGNGKAWAGLPARPRLEDGELVRDNRGKVQYTPQLAWRDERLRQAFSDRVIQLIEASYPEALK